MGPLGRKQSSREPPPPTEAFAGAEHPVPPPGMQVGTCSQLRGAEATLPSSERLHGAPNPQTFPAPPAQIGGISPNPNSSRGRGPQIQMHPVGWGVGGSQSPEHPKLRAMGTRVSPHYAPQLPALPAPAPPADLALLAAVALAHAAPAGSAVPLLGGILGCCRKGVRGGREPRSALASGERSPPSASGRGRRPGMRRAAGTRPGGGSVPASRGRAERGRGGGGGGPLGPGNPPPPPLPCLGRATYLLRGLSRLCARCAAAGFYTGEV